MPPCGRPHAGVIKYSSLSENGKYNDFPDLKPKFNYKMIVIYLKLLLVIYIIIFFIAMRYFIPQGLRNYLKNKSHSGTIYLASLTYY